MSRHSHTFLWKRLFPNWPVPPLALWLTGAACLLCGLALCFEKELWTDRGDTRRWLVTTLLVLLLASLWQALLMLWRWLAAYSGPRWMALLLRLALLGATVAAVVPGIVLLVLAVFNFVSPVPDF